MTKRKKPLRDTPHPSLPQSGEGVSCHSELDSESHSWTNCEGTNGVNPLRDTPHPGLPQSGEGVSCHSELDSESHSWIDCK